VEETARLVVEPSAEMISPPKRNLGVLPYLICSRSATQERHRRQHRKKHHGLFLKALARFVAAV